MVATTPQMSAQPKVTEAQQELLEHLSEWDYLLDCWFECYRGYQQVIAAALRKGWVERPSWEPEQGLVITDAGRTVLEAAMRSRPRPQFP